MHTFFGNVLEKIENEFEFGPEKKVYEPCIYSYLYKQCFYVVCVCVSAHTHDCACVQ